MITPGTSANNFVEPMPAASHVAGPGGVPCATARDDANVHKATSRIACMRARDTRALPVVVFALMMFSPVDARTSAASGMTVGNGRCIFNRDSRISNITPMNKAPMSRSFDLNLLRALVSIHEYGSVSAAAQKLGVSQSAVSTALAKLRK